MDHINIKTSDIFFVHGFSGYYHWIDDAGSPVSAQKKSSRIKNLMSLQSRNNACAEREQPLQDCNSFNCNGAGEKSCRLSCRITFFRSQEQPSRLFLQASREVRMKLSSDRMKGLMRLGIASTSMSWKQMDLSLRQTVCGLSLQGGMTKEPFSESIPSLKNILAAECMHPG